jgi:hypothetical protein
MAKQLLVLLLTLTFTGCSVGHVKLPMTLGPNNPAPPSCVTYSDSSSYGECTGPGKVSIPQEAK